MPETRPIGYRANVEPRMGPKALHLGRVPMDLLQQQSQEPVRTSESILDTLNPNLHFQKVPRPALCSESTLQNSYILSYGTKAAVV